MKILYVHNNADLYGASRCMLRLSNRLVEDGHEVRVVMPYAGPLKDALEEGGARVILQGGLSIIDRRAFSAWPNRLRLLFGIPLSVFRLWREIGAFRPDVVHTNTSVILTSGPAARLRRVRHVWHIREFFSEFGGMWKYYQRFMLAFSDRVLCVSEAVSRQFTAAGSEGKVRVIRDGFPKEEFEPVSRDRIDAFRARYGVEGRLLVGVVGRIKKVRKGQEVLVEAARLLKDRYPEVRYVLVGSPFPGNEEHLRDIQDAIAAHSLGDQVIYTGDVEDIKAAYAALDISVLTSALPEPFGGVVIESMALGRPVIGTRLGGTVEQIEEGVTGLIVEPADPQQLADALVRLIEDGTLRERMGRAGRERFLDRFEFEPYFADMMEAYTGD